MDMEVQVKGFPLTVLWVKKLCFAMVEHVYYTVSNDRWIWSLDSSGEFSIKSTRLFIDDHLLLAVRCVAPLDGFRKVSIKINTWAWKGKSCSNFFSLVLWPRTILPNLAHWLGRYDWPWDLFSIDDDWLEMGHTLRLRKACNRDLVFEDVKLRALQKGSTTDVKGCNSTFIALIPKNPDANMVKDFRPISLIGSIYKIIAKILTNRLVGVLGDIVNEVQSAFISERQILDGPFILNEIMQWCRRRKKQSLIFKVDFEKAYDSVRWDFLDDILVKFGFGIKWRGWIQNCLNSSKGSILVNGSPTEEFQFYKGLKQGDPLSPFLFILVMESLHISFQRVVDVGMFTGIKLSSSLNISHLFYADDAIFLGQWNDSNIDTLVHVMECFYRVSGLRINLCKSKIMGIHVDADRIKSAASKLGCLVLNTPFLYLGTKVGENMSRVHAWKEVIVKIKSRLSNWKLKTLSIGGRFTLLKSVLGSTPIFHMSIYKVPSSVLHLLESIRSHFFHGHDPRSKKASWVNWNKVLTAKERGGLGVSSLYALNRGLMCKWVWRFFAHKSLLWSRVIKAIHGPEGGLITDVRRGFRSTWTSIVQEVKKLQNQGVNIFDYIRIKIGNGDNTSFWKDKWHNEGVLKDVFPRLYALERHQNVTIHTKLIDYSLVNSFRRNPRSGVEEFQLDNLSRLVSTITLSSAVDRYVWSLENSGEFSVKSIRQVIDANCFPVIHSATRWVKSVPLKVNIMAWKIKMDGLPTRMNISRRGIEIDSIVCPICNSGAESSCHIFFQCNLVRQLARKISSWWNVDYVDVSSYEEWYTWLVSLRLQENLKAGSKASSIVYGGRFGCSVTSVIQKVKEVLRIKQIVYNLLFEFASDGTLAAVDILRYRDVEI
ncbi:RNA-directed DNA polymerase, eukaryota, reverse transcriptase zinc-binding domain protein [Tanacetum coccineum]